MRERKKKRLTQHRHLDGCFIVSSRVLSFYCEGAVVGTSAAGDDDLGAVVLLVNLDAWLITLLSSLVDEPCLFGHRLARYTTVKLDHLARSDGDVLQVRAINHRSHCQEIYSVKFIGICRDGMEM